MKEVYLIRHSQKFNSYGIIENSDLKQISEEKRILSVVGEDLAKKFSNLEELSDIDEIWSSNYVRAIDTAKYIADKNNLKINISCCFDERHYGTFNEKIDKEVFWINQFKYSSLKNHDGESQIDVRNRFDNKLNELLASDNKRIAIVCHNAAILFYLLKYCTLKDAKIPKKITLTYNKKILINNGIMESPSMFKLVFSGFELVDIDYIKLDK